MALFFDQILADVAVLVLTLSACVVAYYKYSFSYWSAKGIPLKKPGIPFGNIQNPYAREISTGYFLKRFYDEFKARGEKHCGVFVFASMTYMPIKPEYVRNILAKDFQYFVDRGFYHNEKDDPLSAHLFFIGGVKWRNLRTKLTPTFTSGKMKMMFPTLVECGEMLEDSMKKHLANGEEVDIKEVLGCFTTDIIGSCAFGLECNSFKDPNAPFRSYGRKAFTNTRLRNMKATFAFTYPNLARSLGVKSVSPDVAEFFLGTIRSTVAYREKNNVTRKDFLQILIDLKNNGGGEDEVAQHDGRSLTVEEMAAQAFVFFLAGFETSSSTMTFCLYELSEHQDVQRKVRQEIEAVLGRHGGEITYEAITEMKYMGQVLDETLRKYPPVPQLNRQCVMDYKIPDENIVLDKGTHVVIPTLGLHYDPEYFPDPEKFDPERFSDENKRNIQPYTYLPFGEGPRNCIGLRFGLMQSKVGLAILLINYNFRLSEKTQTPLKIDPKSFILSTEQKILLEIEKVAN